MVVSNWIYDKADKKLLVSVITNKKMREEVARSINKELFHIAFQEGEGFSEKLFKQFVDENAIRVLHDVSTFCSYNAVHHTFYVGYFTVSEVDNADIEEASKYLEHVLNITTGTTPEMRKEEEERAKQCRIAHFNAVEAEYQLRTKYGIHLNCLDKVIEATKKLVWKDE